MTNERIEKDNNGSDWEVPMSFDSIEGLVRTRALDPPDHPGLLARVDRFEIQRLIGFGGMGVVLLARDPNTSDQVAIKLLRPELVNEPQAVHRFVVESQHMQRMSHPNIIKVSEISDRPEGPYFVMPFIERGSLSKLIGPGKPLDYQVTLSVAQEIAAALSYAHSKGIIHRDLKPGNVLIDSKGQAYLADFGLVRTFYNDSIIDIQRAVCEGTAPYMSPAVAAGQAEDTRCDVYSFGAMLYELLTGQAPYQSRTTQEILKCILTGPPKPISELNPKACSGLTKVAEGAMARELRDRYAQMADVVTDLQRVEKGNQPHGPQSRYFLKSQIAFRRVAALVGFVLAAVILTGSIWTAWPLLDRHRDQTVSNPAIYISSELLDAVAGKTNSDYEILDAIFIDDFIDSKIDSSLWNWDYTKVSSYQGNQQFQISESNGSLLIDCQPKQEQDRSCSQDVWLDCKTDLKQNEDVLIEVELSVLVVNGFVAIMLSDGHVPESLGDPTSICLFKAEGNKNHPLLLNRLRIRAELSQSSGMAMVHTEHMLRKTFKLVDISALAQWKLRFYVSAFSPQQLPRNVVQLRLITAGAFRINSPTTIVGHVTDAITNRPLPDATIRTIDGEYKCLGNSQGMYVLAVPAGRIELQALADGYKQTVQPLMVNTGPNKQTVANIQMQKERFAFGDVISCIPAEQDEVHTMTVTDKHVYYTAGSAGQVRLYRMDLDGRGVVTIGPVPITQGLAWRDGTLYGLATSPGRLYRIDSQGQAILDRQLNVDQPEDLALDDTNLWYLEGDSTANRYGIHAMQLATGKHVCHFISGDIQIRGLAWGKGRLWVSSKAGCVYEVDPDRAAKAGKLQAGILREFKGCYSRLSFSGNNLWGLDVQTRRFCQIKIGRQE